MYIMRKMNREKKAATEAERAVLLADGYRDMTPPARHEGLSDGREDPVLRHTEKNEKMPANKKAKAADTKQKKPAKASGSDGQEPAEAAYPVQKETAGETAAPEVQPSAAADIPVQEQPVGLTESAQQSQEGAQDPV
jgi:hypothetical protein